MHRRAAHRSRTAQLFFIALSGCVLPAAAQISLTSTSTAYTQDFNSIGSSATAALPSGFKVDKLSGSPASSYVQKVGNYSTAGTATGFAGSANVSSSPPMAFTTSGTAPPAPTAPSASSRQAAERLAATCTPT
jgi:hypothetical protein